MRPKFSAEVDSAPASKGDKLAEVSIDADANSVVSDDAAAGVVASVEDSIGEDVSDQDSGEFDPVSKRKMIPHLLRRLTSWQTLIPAAKTE